MITKKYIENIPTYFKDSIPNVDCEVSYKTYSETIVIRVIDLEARQQYGLEIDTISYNDKYLFERLDHFQRMILQKRKILHTSKKDQYYTNCYIDDVGMVKIPTAKDITEAQNARRKQLNEIENYGIF